MLVDENEVQQYLLYETDSTTHQHSGFIIPADDKDEVLLSLEGESFTMKYYIISGPGGNIEITSKQELQKWYKSASF